MQVIFVINRSIYFILHIFRETHLKYEYKKKKETNFSFLFKDYLYKTHSVDSIFHIPNTQNIYTNLIYAVNLHSILYSFSNVPSKLRNKRSDIQHFICTLFFHFRWLPSNRSSVAQRISQTKLWISSLCLKRSTVVWYGNSEFCSVSL